MLSVYRKEVKLLLAGFCGGLPLSLLLLAYGILVSVFGFGFGYSELAYPISYLMLALLLILPGMLFAARVRRDTSGWEALLASLPLSPVSVVLGRYFALLTVAALPIPVMLATGGILSLFGEVSYVSLVIAAVGYLLFAAFLLSAGLLLVSLPRRRAVAFGAVYGFSLLVYLLNLLSILLPSGGVLEALLEAVGPVSVFYSFTGGRLPIYGLLYFLSLTALFLLLTVLLEKTRRGHYAAPSGRGRRMGAALLSCALAILLPALSLLLPASSARINLTGKEVFPVSGLTKDRLSRLEEPVTLTYLCTGGKRGADRDIYSFLETYAAASDRITLRVLDPADAELSAAEGLSEHSILVEGPLGVKALDSNSLYFYYNEELNASLSPAEYTYCLSTYAAYLSSGSAEGLNESALTYGYTLYHSTSTVAYFDGDRLLLNAILYVTLDTLPTVYVVGGEGFGTLDGLLTQTLEEQFFRLSSLSSFDTIPSDASLLVLPAPTRDLTEAEAAALEGYLADGGRLFLTTSCLYDAFPRLWALLASFGLGVEEEKNIVSEDATDYLLSKDVNYVFYAHISSDAMPSEFDGVFTVMLAHAIRILPDSAGTVVKPWLYTSDSGFLTLQDDTELKEDAGQKAVGVFAQRGKGKLLWISSPDSLTTTANAYSVGGNFTLLTEALRHLTAHTETSVSVNPSLMPSSSLAISDTTAVLGILVLSLLIPLSAFSLVALRRYVRKKR